MPHYRLTAIEVEIKKTMLFPDDWRWKKNVLIESWVEFVRNGTHIYHIIYKCV